MPKTGIEYDGDYAVLGLSPGAPTLEIRKARKRLAVQYHPDKARSNGRREQNEEQIKRIFAACDDLLAYWKEFRTAPPTDSHSSDAPENAPRSEVPFNIPPLQKTFWHDLTDFLVEHDYQTPAWAILFGAIVAVSVFLTRVALPGRFATTPLAGWLTVGLITTQILLAVKETCAFAYMYKLDRQRRTVEAELSVAEILDRMRAVLERNTRNGGQWTDFEQREDEAATLRLSATMAFSENFLGFLEIRYRLTFMTQARAAARPSSSKFCRWYEHQATAPWWPPVSAFIRKLESEFERTLAA
ncbi:MAG TPA: DnaJ domain-containing protein [Bryobacteraceae bacterium]|nr:DnaJ domain-containing protein [Bryobacteraceae bacterium]